MFNRKKVFKYFSGLLLLILISMSVMTANAAVLPQGDDPPEIEPRVVDTRTEVIDEHQTTIFYTYDDGTVVEQDIVNGPSEPPFGYEELFSTIEEIPDDAKIIADFPSYSWVFGCSAVSGAMVAGYWDRHGFPNMYTGPTNGGVMPLTDTSWAKWSDGYTTYPNNPLIASHKGVDGRTIRGSIDDYWIKSGSTANDPYITGGWTEHTWGTAIGDYMKTSQSKYGNPDGSTMIYQYDSGAKMTCADMVSLGYANKDGTYGRKLFYEKRGYTVTECYNQATDNYATSGGFTLANYKAQIDAGNPVFLSIVGHSMVGYGYGDGTTIYIRNTWDNDPSHTYTMQWGGKYYDREMKGVRIVNIKKPTTSIPKPVSPTGYITDKTPTFKWTRIAGASRYQILLKKGTTTVYTLNIAASCVGSYCTYTPGTKLSLGNYSWQVKAKIGTTWGAYSAVKKFTLVSTVGFNSTFNVNALGWKKVYGPWAIVAPGYYRSNGIYGHVSSIVHDNNYPIFVYTARMMRKGDQYSANRLYVRGTPLPLATSDHNWDDGYYFQYTNGDHFSVWKVINGTRTAVKGWTSFAGINNYGWNTLKVVGVNNSFKFYINNKLVWQGTITGRATGRVGIGAYRDTSTTSPLNVDWATLTIPATVTSPPPLDEPLAEIGDTVTDWDNPNVSPPVP